MRTRTLLPLLHSLLPLVAVLVVAGSGALSGPSAQPVAPPPPQELLRGIYKELVEINTTHSAGDNTRAAEAMAGTSAGGGIPGRRRAGPGSRAAQGQPGRPPAGQRRAKPLLLLAHLDVVEARREDWSVDPFTLLERDGYFYGRGTGDDKAMAAIFVANLIRYKREGFVPDRDLIVALTADEEGGTAQWRALAPGQSPAADRRGARAERGAAAPSSDGAYVSNNIQASEKIVQSFRLEVKNKGGHSSLPVKDNAIYHLADGLTRPGPGRLSRPAGRGQPRILRAHGRPLRWSARRPT